MAAQQQGAGGGDVATARKKTGWRGTGTHGARACVMRRPLRESPSVRVSEFDLDMMWYGFLSRFKSAILYFKRQHTAEKDLEENS